MKARPQTVSQPHPACSRSPLQAPGRPAVPSTPSRATEPPSVTPRVTPSVLRVQAERNEISLLFSGRYFGSRHDSKRGPRHYQNQTSGPPCVSVRLRASKRFEDTESFARYGPDDVPVLRTRETHHVVVGRTYQRAHPNCRISGHRVGTFSHSKKYDPRITSQVPNLASARRRCRFRFQCKETQYLRR